MKREAIEKATSELSPLFIDNPNIIWEDNEGLNIEYKQEYIDEIKKTVLAFANTDGGKRYIGIADDGTIIGLQDADGVMLKVINAVRDAIKPDVTLFTTCEAETIDNKTVVVVSVQKGTACPYYLRGKGIRPEGVYIRQGASTVSATETVILRMIKETSGDNFEEVRSINQDLTFDYVLKEFNEIDIKIEMLQMKTLYLIGKDG